MTETKFKKSEVGLIPEDWKAVPLSSIGEVKMCKRILKEQTDIIGDVPFYKIGTFGKDADAYIPRELYEQFKGMYPYPQKGTILISAAGTIGRTVVFDGEDAYFQDSNIVWIDHKEKKVINPYLEHYFKIIRWKSENGGTISRLYNDNLKSTFLGYPDDTLEQSRIAEALSDIDALIATTKKLIEKKRNIKEGAMQDLLSGKRRIKKFEMDKKLKQTPIGFIPCNWEIDKIGEQFELLPNNTFPREEMSDNGVVQNIHYGDVLIKFGSIVDVQKDDVPYISTPNFKPNYLIKDGDVIIADTAEDETVGKATEITNVGDNKIVSGLHTMWLHPINKGRYGLGFLGYAFNARIYHNQLLPLMQGTKVTSISKNAIQDTFLVVPPKPEQEAIVSTLSAMDEEIQSLEARLTKYQSLKQGMMQQLLTGKIRLI